MPERLFQICGATVPPMVGRASLMQRLWTSLTKPTPDHLQVIGPRFGGKTVLLRALADRARREGSPYQTVILWDLGHQTPESDESFMSSLRTHLVNGLAPTQPQYADYLRGIDGNPYRELLEVIDELNSQKLKILMLWDGFDKPLISGKLNRSLWDQLRELASRPSLRLVTASRRRLHELIRNTDSQTSDFWNIFDPSPVLVSTFDDADIDAATACLNTMTFNPGARTELINWSGGFPPLLLSLLNATNSTRSSSCDAALINCAAEAVIDDLAAMLDETWTDCPESSKDLFLAIIESRGNDVGAAGQADVSALVERGFVKRAGPKLVSACRFLERHLTSRANDVGSMARLFGSPEAFNSNARSLLERRLAHLTHIDSTLKRYIERGIEDIPNNPTVCLSNIRGIIDRALDLIWNAELKDQKIPSEWFDVWKRAGEKGPADWDEQFPRRRGHQIRLLQLMIGTEKSAARARFVTKNSYVLANAAQTFGDFGQHIDGANVNSGVAFAALTVCLELAAALERELPKK